MPPPDEARTDAELIAAANGGDADAMAALYYRYRDWVLAAACRSGGRPEDAPEILLGVFCYLFNKFPGFALTGDLRSYLYPVICKEAREMLRRRQRASTSTKLTPAPPGAFACPGLTDAVARLPEEQREVLFWRALDGLTVEQMAARARVTEETIRIRLGGAVAVVAELFPEEPAAPPPPAPGPNAGAAE